MPTRFPLRVPVCCSLLALALLPACGAEQTIPARALEGTTITLNVADPMIPFGFGLDPAETEIISADPQRGTERFSLCIVGTFDDMASTCPDPRPLNLRLITKVAPHPSSRFAFGEILAPTTVAQQATNFFSPSQTVVLLDIPLGTVAPGSSEQTFALVREPNPTSNSPRARLATTVTVRESTIENFSAIEDVPFGLGTLDAREDIQNLVPQPVLSLQLSSIAAADRPAAAEVVLEYPSDKVSIAGAYDSGIESMVTVRELDPTPPLPAGRSRVQILLLNANPRDDFRGSGLQVVLGPAPTGLQPVTQQEFSIVTTSLFDRSGNATSTTYTLNGIR